MAGMTSKLADRREDTLHRFYTRTEIGDLLVDQLGPFQPSKVLDLGAGEGTLSMAVARRWRDIDLVTVDLDPAITRELAGNIAGAGAGRHLHHIRDVLDADLPEGLGQHGPFDLAVCNPPFFRPAWRERFTDILEKAGLAGACPSKAAVTAEILFLAQNLRLLRDGGKLALIAPDGLMTSWRTAAFRRAILEGHGIDVVVQLPNHAFHHTEARCFLIILTKNGARNGPVKLLRYSAQSGLSPALFVSRDDAEKRMDFDFHATSAAQSRPLATLRQLGAEIHRGSLDTVARRAASFSTFHTTDYRALSGGLIALAQADPLPVGRRLIVAEAGDILMARVDRSLHQKVGLVVSGRAPVTDCIYRVRLPAAHRNAVFEALRSASGAASLLALTKGVSARLLGKADLLDMPLELPA